MGALREDDYVAWLLGQAAALREAARLRPNLPFDIDWELIAQELEGMSRSEARELRSRYAVLLLHMLKWLIQTDHRCRSWELTINHQRQEIAEHLAHNPGLKPERAELFAKAYADARVDANYETGLPLPAFPEACPFTIEQAMDEGFWPE
jgi:Domain of unknown function DUF29